MRFMPIALSIFYEGLLLKISNQKRKYYGTYEKTSKHRKTTSC